MVAFNQIPNDVRVPGVYTEIDNSGAVAPSATQKRILYIATRSGGGTLAAGELVQIFGAEDGAALDGEGSMLHTMIRRSKPLAGLKPTYAVLCADPGGTAGTKTLTFTGTATAAGTVYLLVNGIQVQVAVAVDDTPTDIAAAAATALTAAGDTPYTYGAAVGVCTATAKWTTAETDQIDIRVNYYDRQSLPAGVTLVIAAGAPAAGDPDIDDALTAIAAEHFTHIVCPYIDASNLDKLRDDLIARFGPMDQRWGWACTGVQDTLANMLALGTGRNEQTLSIIENGESSPIAPWEVAAAAVCMTANEDDPARPLQTLTMTGILPPAPADRIEFANRDLLLRDGIATTRVTNGVVQIERLITTYQENANAIGDISYLDQRTFETSNYVRDAVNAMFASKYPRHKLADDGNDFEPTQKVMTPALARAEIISVMRSLERVAIVENIDAFKESLIVERSATDPNRLEYQAKPDYVNQLRVVAGSHVFIL